MDWQNIQASLFIFRSICTIFATDLSLQNKKGMENADIKQWLSEHSDEKLREFSQTLVPGPCPMYGVRIPLLRAFSRKLLREDWRAWLEQASDDTLEEILLQGFVVGYARMDESEAYSRMETYARKISNWMLCDSPCCSFMFVRKDRRRAWAFLQPYLDSEEEFQQRFGTVMLMDHFLTDDYINKVLERLEGAQPKGYYAAMAMAWALSVCFVKYPVQTLSVLRSDKLDKEVYNMAMRKLKESCRIPDEFRPAVRALRRRR